MTYYEEIKENLPLIEKKIGYVFRDKSYLINAFIHSSFINENKECSFPSNERLEFLGDSILNLLVAQHLFTQYPEMSEGELSPARSSIVAAAACSNYITQLDVHEYLLLGKGEKTTIHSRKSSIYADLFEALLGAIYLDGGFEAASFFFFSHFEKEVAKMSSSPESNFKAQLQHLIQKTMKCVPIYELTREEGPDHEKLFSVSVSANGTLLGTGKGKSKKEAEQKAAAIALKEHFI
jgi:ribonuclease III